MRLFSRVAVALLACTFFAPIASGESPKSLYKKGLQAEARQDYQAAYEFYKQAYDQKPEVLSYRVKYERLRFLAAAAHVHSGLQLRDSGNLQGALAEFQKAAQIDPSNFSAQQEVQRTQEMIRNQNGPGAAEANPPKEDMLRQRIEQAQGPVDLAPIEDRALTLSLSGDTKRFYQTIGKLAGINILFDPDFQPRQLPVLELNGVTLEGAFNMISLESGTFWRPITNNTIFVAADTPAKRKQFEQNVIKTFYLSNYSQPSDLQDITTILRQILDLRGVLQNTSQGAVIVRGTPDQVAMAEKIVDDFDKAKPEVVVDVAIMEVDRTRTRNLGLQPPQSVSVQLQPPNAATTTSTTSTTGTTTNGATSSSTNNGLTLNTFKKLNANNFSVSIPQAQLSFLLSDSNTKLLQNPQIRASDGQKATLKIGNRIPIATGSFQSGVGGIGINPLVNTQFQYLDVGVNIDITPRVHANREVSLKVSLVVSSETGTTNIGGIDQPIISQRTVEHDIRLKEGEVNLLGGIFEDQDSKSYSGIPGLGQIPILKYLFGQQTLNRTENEVVFVLIPHIVRGFDINDFNTRVIDVGTSNSIDLRRGLAPAKPAGSAPTGTTPASPRSALTPSQNGVALPGTSTQGAIAAAPASTVGGVQAPPPAQATQGVPVAALKFDPAVVTASVGGTFSVNVNMTGGNDIYSVPVQIAYDSQHLQVVNVASGDLLARDGQPVALVHRDDNGNLVVSATRPPGAAGVSGDGTVFTITFQAKAPGDSVLSITRPGARNSAQQPVSVLGSQMTISAR